jgi:hypothetical protein
MILDRQNARIDDSFESFDDVYKRLVSTLDNLEDIEEVQRILEENSNFIYVEDSTLKPTISNPMYRKLISPERLYISEGIAHKVINNNQIAYCSMDKINELNSVSSMNDIEDGSIQIVDYLPKESNVASGRISNFCSNPIQATYTKNVSGCKKDRRATARVYVYFFVSGNNRTPATLVEGFAERKSSITCNWSFYNNTTMQAKAANLTIDYHINSSKNKSWQIPSTSSGNGEVISWNGSLGSQHTEAWNGTSPLSINIDDVHHEVSSRGIGDN